MPRVAEDVRGRPSARDKAWEVVLLEVANADNIKEAKAAK